MCQAGWQSCWFFPCLKRWGGLDGGSELLLSICALLGTPAKCPLLHGVFCRFEGTCREGPSGLHGAVRSRLCARGSVLADRQPPIGPRAPHEPRRVSSVVPHHVCSLSGTTTRDDPLSLACSLAHPIPHLRIRSLATDKIIHNNRSSRRPRSCFREVSTRRFVPSSLSAETRSSLTR